MLPHAHLQVHLRDKPVSHDIDFKELALMTSGMSGAQVRLLEGGRRLGMGGAAYEAGGEDCMTIIWLVMCCVIAERDCYPLSSFR